jgi:pimeloyl-ACP methyl ester carboxylesterase
MHRTHPQAPDAGARALWDRGGTSRRGGPPRREPAGPAEPAGLAGPAAASLVCLHASASSGRQWQSLQRRLTGRYQVLSPDLFGSGTGPSWPADREMTLADEVARLEPVFESAGEPAHLVGHSYGGAVAARAALTYPGRFRSLVLIEPVLFGLLLAEDPGQPAAREIVALCHHTRAGVEVAALDSAAERFIDYWIGPGTWAAMPAQRRATAAQAMPGVRRQWSAIFAEATPLPAYAALDLPVLYLVGSRSPASARSVARLLTRVLPDVRSVGLEGAGHMAPVTHPDLVGAAIEAHLARSADRERSGPAARVIAG